MLLAGCGKSPTAPTEAVTVHYLSWNKIGLLPNGASCAPEQPQPVPVGASGQRCPIGPGSIINGELVKCVEEADATMIAVPWDTLQHGRVTAIFTPTPSGDYGLCVWVR